MKTGYGRDGGTPADERAGQQGKTNIGLNYRVTPRLYIETVGDRRAENGISGEFCGFARFGVIDEWHKFRRKAQLGLDLRTLDFPAPRS